MAYIGKTPVNGFFAKQDITTDGSTTTFALDFTVSSTTSIIVSVGGVIQEPDVAYTLSGGNTSIVFSTAPASTLDTYIQYLGQAIVQTITDLNGTEMVIDVDGDTTMTADTDDQIDFKLGGSDVIAFKTTGIHLPDGEKYVAGTGDDLQLYHDGSNSYIANAVGALKVATETSGIAVTIGHSTSEVLCPIAIAIPEVKVASLNSPVEFAKYEFDPSWYNCRSSPVPPTYFSPSGK